MTLIENNNCGDEHWTSAQKYKTWGKTTRCIIPNGTTTPANNRIKIAKKLNKFPDVAFHRFMDTEIRQNQTAKTVAEKILGCSLNRRYKPPAWLRRPFPMQHLHSTLVQSPTKAGLMHPQYSNMFKQSILDVTEMIQTCAMRPKNNELFGNTRVLFASKWHQTVWRHFHVALHFQFLLVSFPNQTYNSQFGSIWQNPACESTIHAKLWSFQANWLMLVQFQCAMPTGNKSMASQAKPWPRCITMQQSTNCQFHSIAARFAIALSQHQVAKYLRILRHQPNHAKKIAGTVLTFQITNYKIKRFMYKTTRAATKILYSFTMTINSESPCRCWL